jgi:arylsulfatase A-like enzyme
MMTEQPNIILLVLDSVRATNLSCYGYGRPTTPNIDALAHQGVLFEKAISNGCWTLPVHASLFTGLYSLNHGLTTSKDTLPEQYPTLARQLTKLGYQTASFSNNAYVSAASGLTQGFDFVDDVWRVSIPRGIQRTKMGRLIKYLERFGKPTQPLISIARQLQRARAVLKRRRHRKDKGARATNEKLKKWLLGERQPKQPFFLFVNYMEPHEPYNPPQPYDRRFMPKEFTPQRVARVGINKDVMNRISDQRGQEDIQILKALYDGELNYLDERIGELVKFIDSQEDLVNTVLIVTSDHGDCLGEHNHIGHRMSLYEPLLHIPLIIRYATHFEPGTRVRQQISLIDLYPTMLELAGKGPSDLNGTGLHSLVTAPDLETRPFTIAENTGPKSINGLVARALRTERYKYIWRSDNQHELYDLVKDPGEQKNLIGAVPEVAQELEMQLSNWQQSLADYSVETIKTEYDEEISDRLRQLGYID